MEKFKMLIEEQNRLESLKSRDELTEQGLQILTELNQALQLLQSRIVGRSEQLCGFFESSTKTSSATTCMHCGREKWLHPKVK